MPVIGKVEELPEKARQLRADQVFIALADQDRSRLLHLVKVCEDQQLEFKVVPDLLDIMSSRAEVNSIDGLPLVGIRRSRLTGFNAFLKRTIDVVVSAVALAILAIPFLLLSILIKLTSPRGPVLFTQERIGLRREPFVVYKFRTMRLGAELERAGLEAKNEMDGPVFKIRRIPGSPASGNSCGSFGSTNCP